MARIPTAELSRYLLAGQIRRQGCLRASRPRLPTPIAPQARQHSSTVETNASAPKPEREPPSKLTPAPLTPLRKVLKDEAKAQKGKKKKKLQEIPGWELTVGIEIHAQLNTARKLFSPAATSFNDDPNSHVALFDAAIPGSQPLFQPETLIPAVRAALALGCHIEPVSYFDRKHYFHWDQPAGYQITQYYQPFAKGGRILLFERDGIFGKEGQEITIGIKQVQMEQDTAKTLAQPGEVQWIDFNRVGAPLIEIITLPEIRYPATAAALVRKVQWMLKTVDACVSGMEEGGLRADVNVSVRRKNDTSGKLGTRTEIKNLSSFKSVEDAIIAERDRQIAVLESGGVVEGETRGWAIGSTETRRLRGKEGEVDYRYMPDPDLGPVVISQQLVERLAKTSGLSPDAETDFLIHNYGLTAKDAFSLLALDGGARIQYFYNVLEALEERLGLPGPSETFDRSHTTLAANWCLHELGKLTQSSSDLGMTPKGDCKIPSNDLAALLYHLHQKQISGKVAKELLWAIFRGEISPGGITDAIEANKLWFVELSADEYAALADQAVQGEEELIRQFLPSLRFGSVACPMPKAYPQGKLMYLVGKMMRAGPEERMDPASAEKVLRQRIEEVYAPALGR